MKKVLAILCALAMTASCLSASMFAFAADNLALAGTAIADSVSNNMPIENLNDGDLTTRWQSAKGMYHPDSDQKEIPTYENAPWAGIYWNEAQTFDTVIFWFEASNPKPDGYELYVADEYNGDETVWTEVTGFEVSSSTDGADSSDNDSTDTVTFAEPITAKAIKIVGYQAENKNEKLSIWEIEVFDFSAGTPYDVTAAKKAIAYAEKVDATVGANDTAAANFDAALAAAKAAVAACEGQVLGDVEAYPTQEDLDAVVVDLFNAVVNLTGAVTGENVLENALMICNPGDMQGYAADNNYLTLSDGVWENNANCWQPNNWSTPVYIVLKDASALNELVVYAESTSETYSISYTTASLTNVKSVADMDAISWTDTNAERISATDLGGSTAEQHYAFNTVENVTAIRLQCTVANLGAFAKLREVKGYYDVDFATDVKTLEDVENGRKAYLTVVDRVDIADGKKVYANFTVTFNGKTSVQKVEVKSAFQSVTLGATTYTAKDFDGEEVGYVTGIILEGLTDEYSVSAVTFTIE